MERTPAGLARGPSRKVHSSKISQQQLEKYLKQVLDVYFSKATIVELKLCSSRTMLRKRRLSHSSIHLIVTCTRKSPRHLWIKTSRVWRTGNEKFSNVSFTRRIMGCER